jgi:hypothetical protein
MTDSETLLAADWMLTASGLQFRPTEPDPALVRVTDIAHALSQLCRYNGHVRTFYSVAEHAVLMARHFIGRRDYPLARWALHHDSSEAYLGDVIRPLKKALPDYKAIEGKVEAAIARAFGLDLGSGGEMPPEIKTADTLILHDERRQLFAASVVERLGWHDRDGLGVTLHLWTPDQARRQFLDVHDFLFGPVLS